MRTLSSPSLTATSIVHPRFVPVRWDEFTTHYTMVDDKTEARDSGHKILFKARCQTRGQANPGNEMQLDIDLFTLELVAFLIRYIIILHTQLC